ncbi:hypothetical protein QS257_20955 [Terrilactibacillus sp. S3-3]|nr:hypothetical protein QS257_20955 [Terrilactibacillus sp. S3-3]
MVDNLENNSFENLNDEAKTEETTNDLASASFPFWYTFRQLLAEMQKSGQPIPVVRIANGDHLTNVIVTNVLSDAVTFTNAEMTGTAIFQISQISGFGTF